MKKFVITVVTLVCLLVVFGLAYGFYLWRFERYTDDAYVHGNQVMMTPLREGIVTAIHTDDTFLVKEGQLLIELDETDARLALVEAQDRLGAAVRNVCQSYHAVFAYKSDIEIKKAALIKALQDYVHREEVVKEGGVSTEDFEHAEAALKESANALKMTQSLYLKELSLVQRVSIAMHPWVQEATAALKNAYVQLWRCKIYSPVEGLVAQRKVQVGMYVNPAEPLLNIIPLDQMWVNANYKETQMKKMRIGQRVYLTSDLYGDDVVYHGKIVGLPGGAGNAFSILPPQNLSGNWIKVVQRLPVRVALDADELKRHPLRIGLSMKAKVELDGGGPLVPAHPHEGPNYVTDIFRFEEVGSEKMVAEIIEANLDPTLKSYLNEPLIVEFKDE